MSYSVRKSCRLCDGHLCFAMELLSTPLANELATKDFVDSGQDQDVFPLPLVVCMDCGHVQLTTVVDPERLFREYVYTSGVSPVFISHLKHYADDMVDHLKLTSEDLVVEIGSNDGTLLQEFARHGVCVLGVDPARNIAKIAEKRGVPTIADFFTSALARSVRASSGCARLVVANNVFAHSDCLHDIVDGVFDLLTDDGVFVFEVGYFVDVLKGCLFDTIYHEHTDYHHVHPLSSFFRRHGMTLYDVHRVDSQGGSIRGFARKGKDHPTSSRMASLVVEEATMGLRTEGGTATGVGALTEFSSRIGRAGDALMAALRPLKASGKSIAGYGAPAKCVTLMHQFGFGLETLDFIVDDSQIKHGLYVPGKNVPILPVPAMYERRPDYVLILAWNFADSIMGKHASFVESGGKFIVPLPEVVIHG